MLPPIKFLLAISALLPLVSTQNSKNGEECHTQPLDLVFVVDGSRSVRPWNFKTVQDAIKDMVDTFKNIGPDGTRIGLIQYSSTVETEFRLDEHYTKEDVIEGVDKMKFLAGGTMTGEALKTLVLRTFTKAGGARMTPDVLKVAVIITDGRSQDKTVPIWQQRAKDAGITLFAIGVGRRIRDADLLLIASEPKAEHKFSVKNFDSLKAVPVMVNVQICDVDECKLGNHTCEQICINTPNSYKCDCEEGYKLQPDGVSCVLTTPPYPTDLEFSEITHTSMRLSWSLDAPEREHMIEYYTVAYGKSDGSGSTMTAKVEKGKTVVLKDLEPGTKYNVMVQGFSKDGSTGAVPGAETTLYLGSTEATLSDASLTTLTGRWTQAGGDLLVGYNVQFAKEKDFTEGGVFPAEEVGPDVHEKIFEGLDPGVIYKMIVTPIYGEQKISGGAGEAVETTLSLKAPVVKVDPTTLSTAQVQFTGINAAAQKFIIRARVEGQDEIVMEKEEPGDATSTMLTGLDPDTTYTVTVVGYSMEGGIASPEGQASGTTKKLSRPVVTVTETTLSTAVVNFTGIGQKCDRFVVRLTSKSTGQLLTEETSGSASSVIFYGLQPDTDFDVTVIGYVTEGDLEFSSPVGTATGKTKRVRTPEVDITSTGLATADVSWIAGKADSFKVSYFPVDEPDNVKSFETEDISTKLTGLNQGTEYKVEVVAVVYDDDKPFESSVGFDVDTTKKIVAPPVMANARTYTTGAVKWGSIGMPADRFVLTYYAKNDKSVIEQLQFAGDVNKTTLTGLKPDEEYIVYVYGIVIEDGEEHNSPEGIDAFVLGAIDPPDVVANLSTTTTLTSFWTDKVDPDNYVITIEEVGKEARPPVTIDGDVVGRTFAELSPGTEYKECVVIQVDDEGTIIESPPGCAYGMTKPLPPKNLVATPTPTSIEVTFDPPEGGVDHYEAKCIPEGADPDDVPVIKVAKDAKKFTCDDVKPGVRYRISMVTICSSPNLGKTYKSDPADTSVVAPVGPPRDFELSKPTTHSIVATWSPPEFVEEVTEYVLDYKSVEPPSKGQVRIPGSETTVTLMKLHPDTLYTGTLTAIVGEVTSPPVLDSERTLEDVIAIEVVDVSYNNLTVSWTQSKVPHITSQTLTYVARLDKGEMPETPPLEMIVDVPTTETGYVIDNIKPATIYDIGVQYVYPLGKSEVAKTSGTTLAPPPGTPTFLNVTEVEFVGTWERPRYGAEPISYTVEYQPFYGGIVVEENIPSGEVLDIEAKNLQPATEYNVTVVANYKYGIVSESVKNSVTTKQPPKDIVSCTCNTYLAKQRDMENTINRLVGVIEKLSAKIDNMAARTSVPKAEVNGAYLNMEEGTFLSSARRGDV